MQVPSTRGEQPRSLYNFLFWGIILVLRLENLAISVEEI